MRRWPHIKLVECPRILAMNPHQDGFERHWEDAPVVPTEAGTWNPVEETKWLDEPAPHEREPCGDVVLNALALALPRADERVGPKLRKHVLT